MFISAAKVTLDFWGNNELRDKKKLIEALSQKVFAEFFFKLEEVDAINDLEKCVLGFSICAAQREAVRLRMEKILKFIDDNSAARVVVEEHDIIQFS